MNRFSKSILVAVGFILMMGFTVLFSLAEGAGAASVCKKEIPKITIKNLSPPYKNYNYFQRCKVFPFEYTASSFSLVNAWWLAEAATLVYADEAYVAQQFSRAGLKVVKFFDRDSTQCFIAANHKFAIVAFRGSEIWKRDDHFDPGRILADLKTDIDIRLAPWPRGGKVHSGFKAAIESVGDDLLPEIEHMQAQGIKVWITGHSLGGALATLAADRLQSVQGLYTFGSPKVGDQAFKEGFRPHAFRIVIGNDIVPDFPLGGRFQHVGELKWIDPMGRHHSRRETVETFKDTTCTEISNGSDGTQREAKLDSAALIPSAFRDHVPILYSISLWNELVENLDSNGHR